ncbi:MAG: hypothetical protein OEW87_10900 [Flavobacteriaceae bacterium]|nr:hypothetical protein [Flavobacteriaceae bacterium]
MRKHKIKRWIHCFLCGNQLEVRNSKREKPYLVCDPCGMQVFVRREEGINLLEDLIRNISSGRMSSINHFKDGLGLLNLVNCLEQLQSKREDLKLKVGVFDFSPSSKGINVAIAALDYEISCLENDLKGLVSNS